MAKVEQKNVAASSNGTLNFTWTASTVTKYDTIQINSSNGTLNFTWTASVNVQLKIMLHLW